MSFRAIPSELEAAVAEQVKQKKSTRAISAWLQSTHHLKASHMAVHRLVVRLRYQLNVPFLDEALAEARANIPEHIETLQTIADEFADLAVTAMVGDPEQGLSPNAHMAEKFLTKQSNIIKDLLRFLTKLDAKKATPKASSTARDAQASAELDELEKAVEKLEQRARAFGVL